MILPTPTLKVLIQPPKKSWPTTSEKPEGQHFLGQFFLLFNITEIGPFFSFYNLKLYNDIEYVFSNHKYIKILMCSTLSLHIEIGFPNIS